MNKPFVLIEHQCLKESEIGIIEGYNIDFQPTDYLKEPKCLGIDQNFCASYYIGATWLVPKEWAVIVHPKVPNVDFVKMFLAALEVDTENESDYFSKCYGIQFDDPLIETDERLNQLTPLLVLHYISLLERLVNRGLKKDYVVREENLKSKVKGRILFSKHLKKNVFQQRGDRVFCQFQEYTDDIPENRLLKKALLFAERVVNNYSSLRKQIENTDLPTRMAKIDVAFQHVSDDIEVWQVKKLSANKLFKEHSQAVKVAKMLLRRFQYSIDNTNSEQHTTPPFWIDMARLYEMWVYSKLNAVYHGQIEFQVGGHCRTAADYIKKDERLIVDAKYKPHYEDSNRGIIDDIREISGYARDNKILKHLNADEQEIKCVIIYPQPEVLRSEDDWDPNDDCKEIADFACGDLLPQCSPITWFRNVYKISIPLPTMNAE